MFCPQCEGEFREGFTMCSDCGVPLVESLPVKSISEKPHREPAYRLEEMMEDGVLVYEGGVDLEKGENKLWLVDDLEEKGIPYYIEFIKQTEGSSRRPHTFYTGGVYVSKADSAYALDLVDQYQESKPVILTAETDGYDETIDVLPQVICPNCGKSHDLDYPKCPFCDYEYDV